MFDIGRNAGKRGFRQTKVVRQHIKRCVLQPVGEQKRFVLGKVAIIEDQQKFATSFQSLYRVRNAGREIPEIAEEMSTVESPVIIVDHFQGFDAEEDTYDGVHPNAAGEEKMAQRWFQAIMEATRPN